MITKDQYLASVDHEFNVIRHLVAKLKESELDYRPTAAQRSTRELIQYLAVIFQGVAECLTDGDMGVFKRMAEESVTVTLENFNDRMEAQAKVFHDRISAFTEEQLNETVNLFSMQPRAMHLINGPLKFAAAYKTQLLTYMKQNGHPYLNTSNLWAGKDPEPQA